MKYITVLASLLSAAFFLSGCDVASGVNARIQEKAAVFAGLTAEQKKAIENKSIEVGFTADMVYMALGNPSKVKEKASGDGKVTMWTYNNYSSIADASVMTLNDPSRQAELPTETLHVLFRDGVVFDIKVERS